MNNLVSESRWIRLAIGHVAQMSVESVIVPDDDLWECHLSRHKPHPDHRYPVGKHSHPYSEICIALTGCASFEMGDRCYLFKPGAMAFVCSHTAHCEGFVATGTPYTVMWISFSGAALFMFVIEFDPVKRWRSLQRLPIQSDHAVPLFRRLGQSDKELASCEFETLRAGTLSVLTDLYQLAIDNRQSALKPSVRRPTRHESELELIRTFIHNHLDQPLSLDDMSHLSGLTPNYLNTLFARWTGKPLYRYCQQQRMEKALQLLRTRKMLVKQVAITVGYRDPLYFSRAFRQYYGYSPTQLPQTP